MKQTMVLININYFFVIDQKLRKEKQSQCLIVIMLLKLGTRLAAANQSALCQQIIATQLKSLFMELAHGFKI